MNKSSQPDLPTQPDSEKLTIVGIGASAGGLTALKTLFTHIPEDSGLAFVIVVHLSPDHESHLADLLQPHVNMPVQQVTETLALEANQVYVIPPGCNLNTIDTHLRLSELEEQRRKRAPIDHFFRALASTHDGHAVGIILTGTGSDGTRGLREIKMKGGLTIVQDPSEAEYDGMPQSAISTGLVDIILPLAEIPQAVLNYDSTHPRVIVPQEEDDVQESERQLLSKVFSQIRARTGRDFSRYKRSTILRRIARRMQIRHIEELSRYLELLREEREEVLTLSDDLLITVTNFFRDPEVFEKLEREVIPQLFEGRNPEDSIRVWSVGCATGEEAYSLAILLLEEAARRELVLTLQVFASDLHDHFLEKAREGFYPGDIETDVSEERLKRFFQKEDGGYRINKEVRELVVFAPHNLLSDPPFSKLDLISCRNMLIYLQRSIQRDVIDLFHYALKPEGFLVLGSSETIESSELFRLEDKKHCLYRKRNVPGPEPRLPVFPLTLSRLPSEPVGPKQEDEPVAYGMLHQRMVEQYAPPSLLVSPDDKVVHFSEHVGRYLVHPGGELTANLFKLVREELRMELRTALHDARERRRFTTTKPVPVRFNGDKSPVVLHVRPALQPKQQGFVLIIFDERKTAEASEALPRAPQGEGADHPRVMELEDELELTHKRLQAIIEEYETSQEEMKAANEEMQSSNEELRSTLEELETSKEELQSMNEELQTVNQENRHKVEELAQLSGDLQNLLAATDIATLFLDRELRILRFTPKVGELFNIRTTDRGRPLFDITHRLGYDDLQEVARQVLEKLVPIEREVQDEQGRWYLTRVLPYRSTEDRIEGVVITFVDISSRQQTELTLRQSEEHLRLILESATDYAIFTMDMNRKVTDWNTGAERIMGYTKAEIMGQSADVVFIPEDRETEPEKEMQKAQQTGRAINERWHMRKDGSRFWGSGTMMPLREDHQPRGFLKIMRDDTERRQMEEALREAKVAAEHAAQAKEDFLAHMSHEIRTPLNAITGLATLLLQQNSQSTLQENLETLKFSADNLRLLVNDILDFSKIQAGRVSVEETPVHLPRLLHSLQKAHEPAAREQDNQLQFQIDERIPEVIHTDQLKLSQVLNNLISNALKFTRDGFITVDVSLARRKKGRLWVTFSVQDTGMGIPADKLDSIFEVFTQADISTARQYGGTGLGLSITRLLLELMGSTIEVESEEGEGSRFFFTLPMREGAAEEEPAATSPAAPEEEVLMESLRVLVVEDAAVNRMVLLQFLREWWSLKPDEAVNGQQAIELARQQVYDLILMDIRMPETDGYQAAKAIRELPAYEQVPILALTADTVQEVEKHPEADLFSGVITKPFDSTDLRQKIIRHAFNRINHPSSTIRGREGAKNRTEVSAPAGNRTGMPATGMPATGTGELNLQKVEAIFDNNTGKVREFLKIVLESMTGFQSTFANIMAAKDAAALSDQRHKLSMQLDLLGLTSLLDMLHQCQQLLEERGASETSSGQVEEAHQRVAAMIEQISSALRRSLEQLS